MKKNEINITEFAQEVVKEIEKKIPDAEVTVREVVKTNDTVLHGVTIMEKSSNIAPTIYMDDFFEAYLNGDVTVEQIVDRIIEITNDRPAISFDKDSVMDFENAKSRLRIKLVNTKKNEQFLQDVPHTEFLDLSAIYQLLVSYDGESVGTITVTNQMLEGYGIPVDELHKEALHSMSENERANISSMNSVIAEMIGDMDVPDDEIGDGMLIITNKSKVCGASVVLLEETLQRVAGIIGTDFFILPSSIHETIAVRAMEDADVEGLRTMVTEINSTQVMPEEVLSDNVYYYSIETGELTIA